MKKAIQAKTLYNNQEILKDSIILIEDGIIINIGAKEIPKNFEEIQADIVCPGFLDLQIYGAGNSLFSAELSHESLEIMETELLKQGCTGFLATLATNSDEVFYKAIEIAKSYESKVGNFLGLHLEGPYINPIKRGAHVEEFVKVASVEEIKKLIAASAGVVKMITIAPELQSEEVINLLNEAGIIISAGHSMATFDEAKLFFKEIQAATHLFNAMPALHHREPGLVAAIFDSKPFTSIVADGIHVDFEMIKLAKKLLGNRLFLITDAVTTCNTGPYQHIFQKDKYVIPDGTLSGSSLSMLKAVQNCISEVAIDNDEALKMASAYPAELLRSNDYGILQVGAKANCLLLDDEFNLKNVFFGKTVINNS